MKKILKSFKPFINRQSKVLILGSMPGPEALRKQQYYGFEGNHFWTIIPKMFKKSKPSTYEERLKLVKKKNIALWDVLESCQRPSALDSDIREPKPNRIPQLLKQYSNIRAIFINGKYAHKMFLKNFKDTIDRPVFYMPSTSPAHAAMTIDQKLEKWEEIKKFLKN